VRERLRGGDHREAVTIKNVEVSIIDRAWEQGTCIPSRREWHTGKTVAVVGSGPAGSGTAPQLTRAGHTVVVYERADKPAAARYGIPEFKMEKLQVDRRIDQMRREARLPLRGWTSAHPDRSQLQERYDAVVLAIGATVPRDLAAAGPRARRHPPGDGLPAAGQPDRAR
jgi:glutamate synthase (NADPH/NADH) small chain